MTGERGADEFRVQPSCSMTQEGETAVVVTGAHADAITGIVESDEWRYHQVEVARRDGRRSAFGFPDAVTVARQPGVRRQMYETHAPGRTDHGYEDRPAAGEGVHEQVADLGFGGGREIKTDASRGVPERAARDVIADTGGITLARHRIERETGPLSGLPVSCALGLHERPVLRERGGTSRLCRHQPSLSNQSVKWGRPRQRRLSAVSRICAMLPSDFDPEIVD